MSQAERKDPIENKNNSSKASDLFDQLRHSQSTGNSLQEDMISDDLSSTHFDIESEGEPLKVHQDNAADLKLENEFSNKASVDNKTLSPEARRALVSLLRHGVILAAQKSKLFESICRYQSAVRHYLAEIYLKLILDERTGVAFIARLDESDREDDDEDSVSLITRRTLTLYDTLLLLVLRKHYQERESTGEQRIIIDLERIEAHLTPFLPLTNSSKSDRKKLNAALRKMIEKHILSSVRGSDDRFEITPIIRYVVNAEFLEKMLGEYQRLCKETELTTDADNDTQETTGINGVNNG